jgi:hypothetical protein
MKREPVWKLHEYEGGVVIQTGEASQLGNTYRKTFRSPETHDGVVVEADVPRACVLLHDNLVQRYLRPVYDPGLMSPLSLFVNEIGAVPRDPDSKRSLPAARIVGAIKGGNLRDSAERILRARGEGFNVVTVTTAHGGPTATQKPRSTLRMTWNRGRACRSGRLRMVSDRHRRAT